MCEWEEYEGRNVQEEKGLVSKEPGHKARGEGPGREGRWMNWQGRQEPGWEGLVIHDKIWRIA